MKAASPVMVDLYRLAYNAGRPLMFDELVDGMPSAYQNDANRWYVEKMHPIQLRPDPWPMTMLREVYAEWLAELVHSAIHTKRFSVNRVDGKKGTGFAVKGQPRDRLLYSANKEKPPMVMEEVLAHRIVPWTPEIGAAGRRHVAGIKFRDEMTRIDALGVKARKQDLEEALALAREALSYDRQ